jgi:hypothetical protein
MDRPQRGEDHAGTMDVINNIQRRVDKLEEELDSHKMYSTEVKNSLIRLEERYSNISSSLDLQRTEASAIRTGILISTISAIIAAGMGIFLAGAKITATTQIAPQQMPTVHVTNK